jgi:hypothetical protein
MPEIDGMNETMPGGVCNVKILFGCERCKNATEHYHQCEINQMLPIMLVMRGLDTCPFKNKSGEQIEKLMKQSTTV